MPCRALLIALLTLLALFSAAAGAVADVRIILYHRVGDTRYPTTNISTEAFTAQMQYLRDEGYSVVSTRKLADYLLNGAPLPDKAAVIHFDDGFRSVYDNALPVLKRFGYPFTVFIPTKSIDDGYGDYMSWEMLSSVVEAGGELGAHGHTHPRLGQAGKGETAQEYRARIRDELDRPREAMEEHGFEARWFAYPYGEYSPELVAATKEQGYKLGFVQDPGAVPEGADPFLILRYAEVGTMASLDLFRERMGYAPLKVERRTPGYGVLDNGTPARFELKVGDPGRYRTGQVNMFVSELGRLEATYDPATGVVSAESGKKLTRRLNRVLVSLRDKETGRFALTSWAVLLDQ